eukprot:7285713-Pyramimonas_sp.AAC.1
MNARKCDEHKHTCVLWILTRSRGHTLSPCESRAMACRGHFDNIDSLKTEARENDSRNLMEKRWR